MHIAQLGQADQPSVANALGVSFVHLHRPIAFYRKPLSVTDNAACLPTACPPAYRSSSSRSRSTVRLVRRRPPGVFSAQPRRTSSAVTRSQTPRVTR